jgi:hypothetical protein
MCAINGHTRCSVMGHESDELKLVHIYFRWKSFACISGCSAHACNLFSWGDVGLLLQFGIKQIMTHLSSKCDQGIPVCLCSFLIYAFHADCFSVQTLDRSFSRIFGKHVQVLNFRHWIKKKNLNPNFDFIVSNCKLSDNCFSFAW